MSGPITEVVCKRIIQLIEAHCGGQVAGLLYPDDPDNYDFMGGQPEALVRYVGSDDSDPDASKVQHDRTMQFRVTVIAEGLSSEAGGLYGVVELIRKAVRKEPIQGRQFATVVTDGSLARSKKVWKHVIIFAVTLPDVVERLRPAYPVAKQIDQRDIQE